MSPGPTVSVNTEACLGCGLCLAVCPSRCLTLAEGRVVVSGPGCIGCGHCRAACPEAALTVSGLDGWAEAYATFTPAGPGPAGRGGGEADLAALAALMRGRRSVRAYAPDPVPAEVLDDLIRVGLTAPSGCNAQAWTFTVLPERAAVERLGAAIADFFRGLNRLAERKIVRTAMRLVGRPELEHYFREHYASVKAALVDWDRDRTDRLFHGAPAAILVGSRPGAPCAAEDALLATQNILLAARAMGLGTCLIGYAVEALRHKPAIKRAVAVPAEETIYAVIVLGRPAERYLRPTERRRPVVRRVTG